MANKNNIRSMRFSDEIIEMIEAQNGDSFTKKFENLVTRCMWELPEKEKQLANIEKEIQKKQKDLENLKGKYIALSRTLSLCENYANEIGKMCFCELKHRNT